MQSWDQAVAESGGGYEDPVSAQIHRADWERFHNERQASRERNGGQVRLERWHFSLLVPLLHLMGIMGRTMESRLRVLDVGGSFGSYRELTSDVCPKIILDWTVIETPSTVEAFADLERPDLRWRVANSLSDEPGSYDISFICGTLPYVPDPDATLRKFISLSRFTILGRVPLVEQEQDHCYLQYVNENPNMPAYPGRFLARPRLMQTAMRLAAVRSFFVDTPAIPLSTEKVVPTYYTILLENKVTENYRE